MSQRYLHRVLVNCLLGLGALVMSGYSLPSQAHGRAGFYFGVNAGYPHVHSYGYRPYYWTPNYYYPPAPIYYAPAPITTTVVMPVEAPIYVQRQASASPTPGTQYWYFCREANAYYPYVQECAGSWQPVPVTPPNTKLPNN